MRALASAWPPNDRQSRTTSCRPSDAAHTAVASPAGPPPTMAALKISSLTVALTDRQFNATKHQLIRLSWVGATGPMGDGAVVRGGGAPYLACVRVAWPMLRHDHGLGRRTDIIVGCLCAHGGASVAHVIESGNATHRVRQGSHGA